MIKFKGEFEWNDKQAIILQLEHIGQLIQQGWTKGDGWEIEGKEQAEPKTEDDEEILED